MEKKESNLQVIYKNVYSPSIDHLSEKQQKLTERYRAAYQETLNKPYQPVRELTYMLMTQFGISQSQAYEDVKIVKQLFSLHAMQSKDYYKYVANEAFMEAIRNSNANPGDAKHIANMVAAAKGLTKLNRLDKNDVDPVDWSVVEIKPIQITSDPSKVNPKMSEEEGDRLMKKYKKQFGIGDIEDVEHEELD